MKKLEKDLQLFKAELKKLPKKWEGKSSILELKAADYNWRQMEWWGFYFEFKVRQILDGKISIPGDRFGNVAFDLKGSINWDLKASAIKTNNHSIILNDREAMEFSIEKEGFHGEIIALCDIEYSDVDRSFLQWHTELKGEKFDDKLKHRTFTSISRYRITRADFCGFILLTLEKRDLEKLFIIQKGRGSNIPSNNEKYLLDLEELGEFDHQTIFFQ